MSAVLDKVQADRELRQLLMRIEDPVPFFEYVGVTEKQRVRRRIQYTKVDPDGKAWAPWAPFTADRRDWLGNYSQGIMWDTGRLLNSIEFDIDGAFGVDIGTDVWYAPKHQDGEGKIPKREIFGWDDDTLPGLAAAFVIFLERGFV